MNGPITQKPGCLYCNKSLWPTCSIVCWMLYIAAHTDYDTRLLHLPPGIEPHTLEITAQPWYLTGTHLH